jgi:small redox-active disulfide protein 2
MSANAIQASFTGFCPMFKNARGECVACGVACDAPQGSTNKQGCCDSKDSNCCSDAKSNNNQACCSNSGATSKDCCSDEQKAAGCCDDKSPVKAEHYHILILGTGCANCTNTYKQVEKVTGSLGLNVTLEKVEDVAEIAKYGVMSTPAVVINGQVVHSGGVPSTIVIEKWFGR